VHKLELKLYFAHSRQLLFTFEFGE